MAGPVGMNGAQKLSKRAAARARKKATKAKLKEKEAQIVANLEKAKLEAEAEEANVEIKYVTATDLDDVDAPGMDEFKRVFEAFAKPEELTAEKQEEGGEEEQEEKAPETVAALEPEKKGLSRRQLKAMSRLSIAELKQLVERPEVVEFHDANSADPKLLVHLKAYRNTVPVPNHWSAKRKYLQSKRGYEKAAFELPQFIAETGITEIRQAQIEREEGMKAKSKAKQMTQPKMGKIDIDYQVLHDAFFRNQTKPTFTHFGNLYYEGRELEVKLKTKRPGDLSDELKRALGMVNDTSPPPWLFNMQRFGPPSAYPALKIPGVNAPIPPGARYGFGPGEWGKPPVDEYGRPLYGDVFGTDRSGDGEKVDVDNTLWGQIQSEDEEESEEEDEDEEEENEDEDDDDMESGLESMTSMSSSGMDTPETIQLRKDTEDTTTEGSGAPKSLYTVLEEKKVGVGSSALFGSQHTYVVPPPTTTSEQSESEKRVAAAKNKQAGAVNVALNPEDLENLDAVTLKRKYEAQLEEENVSKKEDVSDVIEENRMKKRKTAAKEKKKQQKYKF